MKIISTIILTAGLLLAAPSAALAKVNIFACTPEWGALAQEIGGDLVHVTTATHARQDVHHLRAKPSLLSAMRRADLVFCSGASLEAGWLPLLLKKAGGPDVQPETIGWIMAANHVPKTGIMEHADRAMGHVHPEGNPHVHLNPENITVIAGVLADRLSLIDQKNTLTYNKNHRSFLQSWNKAMTKWQDARDKLAGQKVVVYHNSWAYLLEWLGIEVTASLEPKPGIPPGAAHLEKVLQTVTNATVTAILVAPYENRKPAQWLSERTGTPVLELPFTVGGNEAATDLFGLFDETLRLLEEAS